MELRHLRYFVAVAEELHFGRAAERLCISQPPLSMQIQQLEAELGFQLFYRTKRRVELTAAGEHFLDEARDILGSLEFAIGAARRTARGDTGRLRIGFVGSAIYGALPASLSTFRKRYPDVELSLRELASGRQARALQEKRIDVGFARPGLDDPEIVCETVLRELLVAAAPAAHRLAANDRGELGSLAEEPFILFPRHPKPSYGDYLVSVCEAAGFTPHVVQEVAEMHTAIGLVAAGIGVSLVPASVQSDVRPGLVYRRIATPAPVTALTIVYRRNESSPVVREFLRAARDAITDPYPARSPSEPGS